MMIEAIRNGEDKRNVENKNLNMIFNGRMMMESKKADDRKFGCARICFAVQPKRSGFSGRTTLLHGPRSPLGRL